MTDQTTTETTAAVTTPAEAKGTALAKPQKDAVADLFAKMQGQWALVLPKTITPERFARIALSQVRTNKALANCLNTEQGKMSLLDKLMKCASIGIEPDGIHAALVPFRDEVTLIVMYQGYVDLTSDIGIVYPQVVCENDQFVYDAGRVTKHIPDFKNPRGAPYAYYCKFVFNNGMDKAEVMTVEEINAIRDRSNGYKNAKAQGKSHPWITDYDEMAKKTVFRRLIKYIPKNDRLTDVIAADSEDYEEPKKKMRNVTTMGEDAE